MNPKRLLVGATFFTVMLSQMLVYPDLENIVVALGLAEGIAESTIFITAEYVAFIIAALIWGSYSDKIGSRRKVISIASIIAGLSYFIMTLYPVLGITSIYAFIAIKMVQGAAIAGSFTAVLTMFLDMKGGNGKNMGTAGFGLALAPAIGFPLGGALSSISTLMPVYVTGAMFLAVGVMARFLDETDIEKGFNPLQNMKNVAQNKALAVPYIFHGADRLSGGIIALAGTFYLRDVVGLSGGAAGGILFALFLPYALFQYPSGILSDKYGRKTPLILGSAIYGLGIMAFGLVTTVPAVITILAITGIGGAIMVPASLAMVGDLSKEQDKGTTIGAMNMFGSIGYLLGTALGGIMTSIYSYTTAFAVFGALQVVLAGLYLIYTSVNN